MYINLAIVAVFAVVYSVISGRVERSMISGPIVFLLFGLVCGPLGLNILDVKSGNTELRIIVDFTLALILFIDAANANLNVLRKNMFRTWPGCKAARCRNCRGFGHDVGSFHTGELV